MAHTLFCPTEKHHRILPEPFLCGSLAVPARECWLFWRKSSGTSSVCRIVTIPYCPAVLCYRWSRTSCSAEWSLSWAVLSWVRSHGLLFQLWAVSWVGFFTPGVIFLYLGTHLPPCCISMPLVAWALAVGTVGGPVLLHFQFVCI